MDDRKTKHASPVRDFTRVHPDHLNAGPGDGVRRVPPEMPDDNEPREVGVVAAGRCIDVPTDEIELSGYDREGQREIYRRVQKRHLPGESVELPKSEIARLRGLGFLVDPSAAPLPVDRGRRAAGN